jgi:hypothetical protein
MTKPEPKITISKLIDSDGQIREGQLLTEAEVAVFDDPMFEAVTMNTHVKGAFISTASMHSILGYILTRYTMTLRHEVASSRDDQSEQDEQENQAEPQETWIEDTHV